MKPSFNPRRLPPLALLCLGCVIPAARPALAIDRAVVVGVNLYPGLADASGAAPNLEGCVTDARSVASSLKSFGFEVTLLADGEATHDKIVAAIKGTKGCDRFVFYFAGHGDRSTARGAILLPHDALESSEKHDIAADDLNFMVKAVPATKRTVLLDSCFSGGMMRSALLARNGARPLRTRFHHRKVERAGHGTRGAKDIIMRPFATHADANEALTSRENTVGGPTVCYFTATRDNEQAGEYDFQGTRHGVFTYFLTRALAASRQKVHWSDIQGSVSGSVSGQTGDEQHPTLSPAYVDSIVFEDKPAPTVIPSLPSNTPDGDSTTPVPVATPSTLWEDYNRDRVDRSKLFLTMNPDQTTLEVGQQVDFSATVAATGYLVIMEKGTSGHLNLLYPRSASLQDAQVEAGSARHIPREGFSYAPDAPGTERIRALLLTSADTAQKLLAAFQNQKSLVTDILPLTWAAIPTVPASAYTSDFTCEIVPKEK